MSKVSLEPFRVEDEADRVRGADRRRSDRSRLLVRIDYSTVDEIFSEFTRDINEGGLFIETEKPRPTGTTVSMLFNLPGSEQPLQTVGTVVRVSPGGPGEPPGMGIEFEELDDASRRRINDLIRALRTGTTTTHTLEPRESSAH